MGRRWIAFITLVIGALVAPITSAAGGGAVFTFDRQYYVPGDQVEGIAVVNLGVESEGISNDLGDGPFYAYLVRSGRDHVPGDPEHGVLLGRISFGPVRHQQVEATVSFVVPDVKPGPYAIETCNRDCSVHWIGDLVGGWFTVVATREEIPFRELEDRLTDQIRSLRGRLELFRDRLVEVETQANTTASDAQLAVDSGRDLEAAVRDLQAQLASLRDEPDSTPFVAFAGWLVAGLVAGVGVAVVLARRRRGPVVRTTPPEDGLPDVTDDLWRPDGEPELVSSGRR